MHLSKILLIPGFIFSFASLAQANSCQAVLAKSQPAVEGVSKIDIKKVSNIREFLDSFGWWEGSEMTNYRALKLVSELLPNGQILIAKDDASQLFVVDRRTDHPYEAARAVWLNATTGRLRSESGYLSTVGALRDISGEHKIVTKWDLSKEFQITVSGRAILTSDSAWQNEAITFHFPWNKATQTYDLKFVTVKIGSKHGGVSWSKGMYFWPFDRGWSWQAEFQPTKITEGKPDDGGEWPVRQPWNNKYEISIN